MERVDYFKVFAFLAFVGSAFLSTVFHYPVFTTSWFVVMILFMSALGLSKKNSELIILAFTALAYIPLGLISLLSNYLSKTPAPKDLSDFAWLLFVFVAVELILAIVWITDNSN